MSDADSSGDDGGSAVQAARRFLQRLRKQIPLDVFAGGKQPAQHSAEVSVWNPVPAIAPEDYDRVRQECAEHIIALCRETGS